MVEKSKICFIINRLIKQMDNESDAVIAKIKTINARIENCPNEENVSLRERLSFNHGASVALDKCQYRLRELLRQIEDN